MKNVNILLFSLVESLIVTVGVGLWLCSVCGYQSKNISHMKNHIEAKHLPYQGYACPHCSEHLKNKIALQNHLSRKHKFS